MRAQNWPIQSRGRQWRRRCHRRGDGTRASAVAAVRDGTQSPDRRRVPVRRLRLPPELVSGHREWIEEYLRNEVENRLCGTDIRLGVIGESGTSGQFDEVQRRVLVAGARVATTTGLPVNIEAHPPANAVTLDILGTLSAVGPDLLLVYLSHLAEIEAVEYLVAVLETGTIPGFDSFGQGIYSTATWKDKSDLQCLGFAGMTDRRRLRGPNRRRPGRLHELHAQLLRRHRLGQCHRADDAQAPRFLRSTGPTDQHIAGGEPAPPLTSMPCYDPTRRRRNRTDPKRGRSSQPYAAPTSTGLLGSRPRKPRCPGLARRRPRRAPPRRPEEPSVAESLGVSR